MELQRRNEPPSASRRELRLEHYVALGLVVVLLVAGAVWLFTG